MPRGIDLNHYIREYHENGEIIVRGKWTMDGAETLEEASGLLRAFADELEALADVGFHLMGPVEDDHGFAHRAEEAEEAEIRPPRRVEQHHHLNESDGPRPLAEPAN